MLLLAEMYSFAFQRKREGMIREKKYFSIHRNFCVLPISTKYKTEFENVGTHV